MKQILIIIIIIITGKNILVFDEGRTVKLADFGSAMKKEEISMTGSLIGCTPHYSAPEVLYTTVHTLIDMLCNMAFTCTCNIPQLSSCHQFFDL